MTTVQEQIKAAELLEKSEANRRFAGLTIRQVGELKTYQFKDFSDTDENLALVRSAFNNANLNKQCLDIIFNEKHEVGHKFGVYISSLMMQDKRFHYYEILNTVDEALFFYQDFGALWTDLKMGIAKTGAAVFRRVHKVGRIVNEGQWFEFKMSYYEQFVRLWVEDRFIPKEGERIVRYDWFHKAIGGQWSKYPCNWKSVPSLNDKKQEESSREFLDRYRKSCLRFQQFLLNWHSAADFARFEEVLRCSKYLQPERLNELKALRVAAIHKSLPWTPDAA